MAYALFLFLCLTPNQLFGFSRKYLGIDDALLPNREWNQKQKHKKQPRSKAHSHYATLLRGPTTLPQG